jgi:glutamyl-tRNA synthetase/glutamyl-Q tRNA(Asp) synthetase
MGAIITRFAPAPTGFLHLGHVVNAICTWGIGGRVLLRIEDHDRTRSRREFETAILEDLAWLGFVAHEGPVRQSERDDTYRDALESLRRQGLVYACDCSRSGIAQAAKADPKVRAAHFLLQSSDALRYPGTCRERGLVEGPGLGLRVRLNPSVETFVDGRHGPQVQRPFEQCGDLLVRDRDGQWTYQFAATVDDYVQGVTHVVRGDDLLASTGRQLQLARLLGRVGPARFLHHPLIMKTAAQKLSKSDHDSGIRELRAQGWTPGQVIAHARARAGLDSTIMRL